MKNCIFSFWGLLSLTLCLTACGGGRNTQAPAACQDTIRLTYAENLMMAEGEGYTLVKLRNPWDTLQDLRTYVLVPDSAPLPAHLPEGDVVRIPLRRSVFYSSVHSALLYMLDAQDAIAGQCDLDYSQLSPLHQAVSEGRVADLGNSMSPDIERVIDLHPDAVWLSPFENSGGYGRIEKLGIPLIECADYMETSPLGRAEWMRFYGRLLGCERQADSLFQAVESAYNRLKERMDTCTRKPSVISELKSGSAWYVAGGRSTVARFFADAGGSYPFADDTHSGSVPLAFETVFDRGGEADVWIIKSSHPITYASLRQDFAGYAGFKAFRERHIYHCHTVRVPYYEETPFRPDYLLADFIRILHPELADMGDLRYFCKID